jgi:hypothetical protein
MPITFYVDPVSSLNRNLCECISGSTKMPFSNRGMGNVKIDSWRSTSFATQLILPQGRLDRLLIHISASHLFIVADAVLFRLPKPTALIWLFE